MMRMGIYGGKEEIGKMIDVVKTKEPSINKQQALSFSCDLEIIINRPGPTDLMEDDSKENSQTLCVRCNQLKNDEFISNEELLIIRNKYKELRNNGIKHNDVMKQLVK